MSSNVVRRATTRPAIDSKHHTGIAFADAGRAELYADVYFDVNGFVEQGTGERGVPPEII